ncbi:helix-turn-helix domain-containing protein [Kribbella qitaiheensis]|uniref:helix-turn-helix domain-containing protein n=1 Tax=Kribbella qitaiheensis TaxID=1544730 RepID=UPI001FE7F948|nr:helix-turn-helix domain-containing protein [Kribbella qitaiheensis]
MPHFRSQELVDSALRMSDDGVSDRANAEVHGVAIKTIRRWRRQYQELGLPRGQGFRPTPCPRCDGADLDEAAYALLLGWYLGDGHIVAAKRGVYTLQVANDEKYPELSQEASAEDRAGGLAAGDRCQVPRTAVARSVPFRRLPIRQLGHSPDRGR